MSDPTPILLTTKDYTILEVMLDRCLGRDDPLAGMLRRKLSSAVVMFRDDIPSNVVTLSSRVTYRIDGNPAETRILAADDVRGLVGLTIPLGNPRGLALLGLTEGQSDTIEHRDGRIETIMVEQVVYQPEAARREASRMRPPSADPKVRAASFLKVVHRSDDTTDKPAPRRALAPALTDPDDPGPSAA